MIGKWTKASEGVPRALHFKTLAVVVTNGPGHDGEDYREIGHFDSNDGRWYVWNGVNDDVVVEVDSYLDMGWPDWYDEDGHRIPGYQPPKPLPPPDAEIESVMAKFKYLEPTKNGDAGPIYNARLIDTLPLNNTTSMIQAMPSEFDLVSVRSECTRVVAGYELLLLYAREMQAVIERQQMYVKVVDAVERLVMERLADINDSNAEPIEPPEGEHFERYDTVTPGENGKRWDKITEWYAARSLEDVLKLIRETKPCTGVGPCDLEI